MSGAKPLLPIYACMACYEEIVYLYLYVIYSLSLNDLSLTSTAIF
jgi:hypothetical protein